MKATQQLHDLGQRLWLDNITRELISDGTLRRYIDEFSITGLTSNPTIFDQAIRGGHAYDTSIRQKTWEGKSAEALFLELALEDLTRRRSFRPIHDATEGIDGWVSLEVSRDDGQRFEGAQSHSAHALAPPNLFIKIPGTSAGLLPIEESISAVCP
jgi:transaldolase